MRMSLLSQLSPIAWPAWQWMWFMKWYTPQTSPCYFWHALYMFKYYFLKYSFYTNWIWFFPAFLLVFVWVGGGFFGGGDKAFGGKISLVAHEYQASMTQWIQKKEVMWGGGFSLFFFSLFWVLAFMTVSDFMAYLPAVKYTVHPVVMFSLSYMSGLTIYYFIYRLQTLLSGMMVADCPVGVQVLFSLLEVLTFITRPFTLAFRMMASGISLFVAFSLSISVMGWVSSFFKIKLMHVPTYGYFFKFIPLSFFYLPAIFFTACLGAVEMFMGVFHVFLFMGLIMFYHGRRKVS